LSGVGEAGGAVEDGAPYEENWAKKAVSTPGGVLAFSGTSRELWSGTWAAVESSQITLAVKSTFEQEKKFENH
jgi:hypothetical protein